MQISPDHTPHWEVLNNEVDNKSTVACELIRHITHMDTNHHLLEFKKKEHSDREADGYVKKKQKTKIV